MEDTWTILELAELAAERLAAAEEGGVPARANGRVRDVPNERLIRWYVTVGLVDPPLSRRGRVARYGRRHLLQLVAVKRRQAAGRSLAEIQAELAGATDESLARVAGIPDIEPGPAGGPPRIAHVAPDGDVPGPDRFWARPPSRPASVAVPPSAGPAAGLVRGIRLAPGVTLLLEGADHEPGPAELTRIVNAAGPLLRELAGRGLLKGAGHDH